MIDCNLTFVLINTMWMITAILIALILSKGEN